MKLLCIYKHPPSSLFTSVSKQLLKRILIKNPSSSSLCCIVHALKDDSKQQYEIDPEKAKEALKELDQQIQSISNKQTSSPKLKALDMKPTREEMVSENGKLEITESSLALLAGGLVLFTILYNVLFITVIKPSIDGP